MILPVGKREIFGTEEQPKSRHGSIDSLNTGETLSPLED